MTSDPGMLPPVPAQYGALDGGPPGTDFAPRAPRRGVKALGRVTRPVSDPATAPEAVAVEHAPTGVAPVIDDRGMPFTGPGVVPDGTGPMAPGGPLLPRPRWRDRDDRRAAEWPDGAEEYLPGGRFRREKVRVVRGRRSRRIVRRIDTWTVLKVSLLFYLCALIVVLVSGVVLWNVAQAFNFTHDIEKSVKTLFGYNTFTLHPGPLFEYTALAGLVLCVVGTLVNLLVAMVYNLISDVVGGIQVVVITEEVGPDVR
jgi:hypothetical protein